MTSTARPPEEVLLGFARALRAAGVAVTADRERTYLEAVVAVGLDDPVGVYHAGRTAGVGPYGGFSTGHAGAYGYGGASYHAGYGAAAGVGYHPYGYGGAGYAGGYRYGSVGGVGGAYAGGVYRRW